MKVEEQVCNLQQAKKLKDLGVETTSLFYYGEYLSKEERKVLIETDWQHDIEWEYGISNNKMKVNATNQNDGCESSWCGGNHPYGMYNRLGSAFTVAELGVMLPIYEESHKASNEKGYWYCGSLEGVDDWVVADTQAEVMAKRLIGLIESQRVRVEEINKALNHHN